MTPSFEKLQNLLKRLPGLGYRSAERIALHLLLEKPELQEQLIATLRDVSEKLGRCPITGNLCEGDVCAIYANPRRSREIVCVVEQVTDVWALEKSGVFQGTYHVLLGKLSPIQGVGPENLNFEALRKRMQTDSVSELILALGNDIEGEATCHYIQEVIVGDQPIKVSRIGFGLPSGSGITYADPATLKSAMESRRNFI